MGYLAPRGYIAGEVNLKREFEIRDAILLNITDRFRRLTSGEATPLPAQGATPLQKALDATGQGQMAEAIETIQPEQYEEIAASEKPVMVLQGAAGSGKSLVGLHRIAYLLSPFSEVGRVSRPRPNRVVMFGSSNAFLTYVSSLLPPS